MRYLQVKAVIFEEIIKVTALTATFNSFGSDDMKYIERPEYIQRLINLNKQKTIGWINDNMSVVDRFAATFHVETVCLLGKQDRKPDSYIDFSLDMEDYYRIKGGKRDGK